MQLPTLYISLSDFGKLSQLSAEGTYTEGFDFEVDQPDSIEVHIVVNVIYCSYVGGNLRKYKTTVW